LEDLLAAALSAAAPGRHAVSCRWDSAYVSGTVMSHAKGLPLLLTDPSCSETSS